MKDTKEKEQTLEFRIKGLKNEIRNIQSMLDGLRIRLELLEK